MPMIRYSLVKTEFGWVGLGKSPRGLAFLTLPKSSKQAVSSEVENLLENSVSIEDNSAFGDLPYRLQRYFEGEKVIFPDRLDLSHATLFQRKVWSLTRAIPYGQTRTYAWVARQIGSPKASRAVGGALARNRFPIIVPCHRVTASDGSLGGFSGGLEMKKRLLALESGV